MKLNLLDKLNLDSDGIMIELKKKNKPNTKKPTKSKK